MRASPGPGSSRPPLKKNVTCGYFSVSAARSCVRPARETTSPSVSARSSFANATGIEKAWLYDVIVTR